MKKLLALGLVAGASVVLCTGTIVKAEERMTSQDRKSVV